MIIKLPQDISNAEFDINIDNAFYIIKISYNCIFSKFFATVFDSDLNQISTDTMLDEGVDIFKTTNILRKLVFKGQQLPKYNNLTGHLVLEAL